MRKWLLLLGITIMLSGCNSVSSFNEVSVKDVKKNIQSFMADVKDENGTHLYFDGKKAMYVYLNGGNVIQGEQAVHFTNFKVQENGDTLNILYNTAKTTDYSNQSLKHELLYKVDLDKKYEFIKLFSNGEEVSVGVVSGNQ